MLVKKWNPKENKVWVDTSLKSDFCYLINLRSFIELFGDEGAIEFFNRLAPRILNNSQHTAILLIADSQNPFQLVRNG